MGIGKNLAGTFMLAAGLWSGAITYEQVQAGNAANSAMAGMSTVMWVASGALTFGRRS